MSKQNKTSGRTVIHMEKRNSISRGKAWAIRLTAVLLSLIVCAIVIVAITKQNPLQVYAGIIQGAVGSKRRIWVTVRETVVLLVIAVGLVPAFRMRFWNIGAEGQILMGGAVERNLGHIRYLFLYLVSGIGGNVVSVLYDRAQGVNTYSVGASGAVFGVMGTLIILILRGRKKLRSGSSLLPRAAFAVFYAVYSGFRNPYTDNAAHLGGLLFGAALGTLLTVTLEDVDLQDLR